MGHAFPVRGGIIDFVGSERVDEIGGSPIDHGCEASGMALRLTNFIIPRIEARFPGDTSVRVLDDGCGVGTLVNLLVDRGIDAWGVDPGSRTEVWEHATLWGRKHIAEGGRLPFEDRSFHVALSSGVLEHVGEHLGKNDRDEARRSYLEEMVRVLRPGGIALVAHPNGAHPVDFWHPQRFSLRLHRPYEGWMPNARQLRRWAADLEAEVSLRFLPPAGYLAFERVRQHRYGRLLRGTMVWVFSAITRMPFMATTPLNPWLVTEITRR